MSSERFHISRRPLIGSDPRRPVGFYLEIVIDRGRNGMIFMALITDALYNMGVKTHYTFQLKKITCIAFVNIRADFTLSLPLDHEA